jgi:hypothetical protein
MGIFVVPVIPMTAPAFLINRKNPDGTGNIRRFPWYEYLMSFSLITFDLPSTVFTNLLVKPMRFPHSVQAVVANFGHNTFIKRKPRPEHHFRLEPIPSSSLLSDGPARIVAVESYHAPSTIVRTLPRC